MLNSPSSQPLLTCQMLQALCHPIWPLLGLLQCVSHLLYWGSQNWTQDTKKAQRKVALYGTTSKIMNGSIQIHPFSTTRSGLNQITLHPVLVLGGTVGLAASVSPFVCMSEWFHSILALLHWRAVAHLVKICSLLIQSTWPDWRPTLLLAFFLAYLSLSLLLLPLGCQVVLRVLHTAGLSAPRALKWSPVGIFQFWLSSTGTSSLTGWKCASCKACSSWSTRGVHMQEQNYVNSTLEELIKTTEKMWGVADHPHTVQGDFFKMHQEFLQLELLWTDSLTMWTLLVLEIHQEFSLHAFEKLWIPIWNKIQLSVSGRRWY